MQLIHLYLICYASAKYSSEYSRSRDKRVDFKTKVDEQTRKLRTYYNKVTLLGEGGGGKVYSVKSKRDGRMYAVKEVLIKKELREVENYELFKTLDGFTTETFVEYYDFWRENKYLYIRMELCNHANLWYMLYNKYEMFFWQKFYPEYLLSVFLQILEPLSVLHRHGWIHRDIKPLNIFICGNQIKLGDYGYAVSSRAHWHSRKTGTPGYMAPEVFRKGPFKKMEVYSPAVDIYSLGIVLAKMMTNEPVPSTRGMYVKMNAVLNAIPIKKISNLCRHMLRINPEERPTIFQIQNVIRKVLHLDPVHQ